MISQTDLIVLTHVYDFQIKRGQTDFRPRNTSYNSLNFYLYILNEVSTFRAHFSRLPITEAVRIIPIDSTATKF
jgi:hypothetical protein